MRWPGQARAELDQQRQQVRELVAWLRAHQAEYDEALGKRSDPEWLLAAVGASIDVWYALRTYRPGQNPVRAVYVLAQAEQSLGSIAGQLAVIEQYESARDQLRELVRQGVEDDAGEPGP